MCNELHVDVSWVRVEKQWTAVRIFFLRVEVKWYNYKVLSIGR